MLRLYHAWASTCSQKVRLALAEKELAYDGVVLNLRRFEQLAPDFLAINSEGVVPVLVHDGFTLRELTIINDYLDDAFPDCPLRPADAKGRARVATWSCFVDDVPTLAIKKPSFQRNMRPFLQSLPEAEIEAAVRAHSEPGNRAALARCSAQRHSGRRACRGRCGSAPHAGPYAGSAGGGPLACGGRIFFRRHQHCAFRPSTRELFGIRSRPRLARGCWLVCTAACAAGFCAREFRGAGCDAGSEAGLSPA